MKTANSRLETQQANKQKRNSRIREQFRKLYTDVPRPRVHSREYIISGLAEKFFLAPATVEDIVYQG